MAVTDAEGRFRITGVAPGKYALMFECPGFETMRGPRSVSLEDGQAMTGVEAKLTPLGVLTGKIVNEEDEPMAGIQVQTVKLDYYRGRRAVSAFNNSVTNDRGEYRIFNLPSGLYYILVNGDFDHGIERIHGEQGERGYPDSFYPGVPDISSATPVKLAAGAEIRGLDFRLKQMPLYHFRGMVLDSETQTTQSQTEIRLLPAFSTFGFFLPQPHVVTNGRFDLVAPPGQYRLQATKRSMNALAEGESIVTVTNRDAPDISISMSPALEVDGQFSYEGAVPAAEVRSGLNFEPMSGAIKAQAEVKSATTFVIHQATQEDHLLNVVSPPKGYYVKSVTYGDGDVSDGRIRFTPKSRLTVLLAEGAGTATITVQGADGKPAAGVLVSLVPENGRPYLLAYGRTDNGGVAVVENLAPGDYKAFAWPEVPDHIYDAAEFRKLVESHATAVAISPNGNVTARATLIPPDVIEDARGKFH